MGLGVGLKDTRQREGEGVLSGRVWGWVGGGGAGEGVGVECTAGVCAHADADECYIELKAVECIDIEVHPYIYI